MSRPTYAEAGSYSRRTHGFGTSLKRPEEGGPSQKDYAGGGHDASAGFLSEHPRYPDYQYPEDKDRDTDMMIKANLARGQPLGNVIADKSDIQYIKDKKNAQELALFKQFVEDSLPRGTPWAREFFERIMPGWYQSKIDIIQDKLSIINRFIDITIRGPQNIDDMWLLFLLYNGTILIPANWQELIHGPAANLVPTREFASGLFNPKLWLRENFRVSKRNQEFMANFAIPGIDTKGLANNNLVIAAPAAVNEDTHSSGISLNTLISGTGTRANSYFKRAVGRELNDPALVFRSDGGAPNRTFINREL